MPQESDENHPTSFRLGPLTKRLKRASEESGVAQITIAEVALTLILERYDAEGIVAFDRRQIKALRPPAPESDSAQAQRMLDHAKTKATGKASRDAGKALQKK